MKQKILLLIMWGCAHVVCAHPPIPGDGKAGAGGAGAIGDAGRGSGGADGGLDATDGGGMGGAGGAIGGPSVLMRGYDLARTSSNLEEAVLRPSLITASGFGKLFCKAVDGDIYGQILYAGRVDVGGGRRRNVVYVVTMNDSLYAFDADDATAAPLWQINTADPGAAITPVPTSDLSGGTCNPYQDIAGQVGITSTPAVDPATLTIYFVARTKEAGSRYVQRLHAVDMLTGSQRPSSPVEIDATAPGTGDGSTTVRFQPQRNNQRVSLLLHDDVVYVGFSSHCDGEPYHGWLLGYDARTLSQVVVYTTTPNGRLGGIWMAGMAPAVDETGDIYLVTGNGSADLSGGGPNRGEAFVRLRRQGTTLSVIDWFTPANYQTLENEDRDLGSSGAMLIPGSPPLVLGGNKEGRIYVLDRNNMGKYRAADNNQIVQTIPVTGASRAHIHGTPVYWRSTLGEFVYIMAEEDYLRQYRISGGQLVLERTSQVRAPVDPAPASGYTMPGGILALSAAGDQAGTGLLWVSVPVSRDSNHASVPGMLRVFDADDVTGELWNSEQNLSRDSFGNLAKFNAVTVVNGKAYVPTFSNQFCVYGPLN